MRGQKIYGPFYRHPVETGHTLPVF